MIRVAWVTAPGEVEWDLAHMQSPDVTVQVYPIGVRADQTPHAAWVFETGTDSRARVLRLLQRVVGERPDLTVFRYPAWAGALGIQADVQALFRDLPTVCWCSEQGPTVMHAYRAARPFRCVAVNNRLDVAAARGVLSPDQKIFYLPHGCVVQPPALPQEKYRSDLVADGGAHYHCRCEDGAKTRSCEVMVEPFVQTSSPYTLALYGSKDADHGWPGMPGALPHFRGDYPWADTTAVYASAKIYLGISWNWRHSGYGVKLARALGAGIATVWHRTPGMDEDGLVDGVDVCAVSSPGSTRAVVDELMRNDEWREDLAARGQQFAHTHWNWETNLINFVKEVHAS